MNEMTPEILRTIENKTWVEGCPDEPRYCIVCHTLYCEPHAKWCPLFGIDDFASAWEADLKTLELERQVSDKRGRLAIERAARLEALERKPIVVLQAVAWALKGNRDERGMAERIDRYLEKLDAPVRLYYDTGVLSVGTVITRERSAALVAEEP